jgi:hypothetical protein
MSKPITEEVRTLCRISYAFWTQDELSDQEREDVMDDFARHMLKLGYTTDDLKETLIEIGNEAAHVN